MCLLIRTKADHSVIIAANCGSSHCLLSNPNGGKKEEQ